MVVLGDSATRGRRSFPPSSRLSFYSDASDIGWGAIVGERQVSGVLDSKPRGILHQPQGDDGSAEWPLKSSSLSSEARRSLSFATMSRQSLISGDWEARGLRSCSSK